MNTPEQLRTLTEPQLIGKLILGTEGKPINAADLPEVITLSGVLLKKANTLAELSAVDPLRAEHSFLCTTEGDRRLHIPQEAAIGSSTKVTRQLLLNPLIAYPLGMHSHGILDSLPSLEDISNLLRGREGIQAELIVTPSAFFLCLRTSQTPILDLERKKHFLLLSREKILQGLEKLLTTHESEIRTFVQTFDLQSPEMLARSLEVLLAQQQYERNVFIAYWVLEACNEAKITFYMAPRKNDQKDAQLLRVHTVDDLEEYLGNKALDLFSDIDHLTWNLKVEQDPTLLKVDPDSVTETQLQEALDQIKKIVEAPELTPYFPNGINSLFEEFRRQKGEVDIKAFIATLLEIGHYNPQRSDSFGWAILKGTFQVISDLGIVKEED